MAKANSISLDDKLISISISPPNDLAALNLTSQDLDILLEKIVTKLITYGARIGYGGNLDKGGFTYQLFSDIASQTGLGEHQFIHYIAAPVWANVDAAGLFNHIHALHNIGKVRIFLPDGSASSLFSNGTSIQVTDGILFALSNMGEISSPDQLKPLWDKPPNLDPKLLTALQSPTTIPQSLSDMRKAMASQEYARIVIGGQVTGYTGSMPGVAEEAIEAVKADTLMIPIASYGGCARFISHSLGLISTTQLLPQMGFGPNFTQSMNTLMTLNSQYQAKLGTQKYDLLKQVTVLQKPDIIAKGILSLVI